MSAEAVIYPFLFLAIFFESFMLVTFLSRPARVSRAKAITQATPRVAIVVSCWNEESTIAGTIESLLALDYPADKLSLILVDDGSTDGTPVVLDRFASHPQINALYVPHGGKFRAMNYGIEHASDAELIGFLDADSFVAPDALREIVATFDTPKTMAVIAAMSIYQPRTLIQRMQYAEYSMLIALRHILASVNALSVTPGPFSFYRRTVFVEIGLFKHAYNSEDMEMALRMQRAGYHIANAIHARVFTKGPPTFPRLIKQRVRWTTGFLRTIFLDYRDLLGFKNNATLGVLVLPLGILSVIGGILVFLIGAIELVRSSWHTYSVVQAAPLSYAVAWHPISWFYFPITSIAVLGVILMATTIAWMAIGKSMSKSPGSLTSNVFVYVALYWIVAPFWLLRSMVDIVRGIQTSWR
jgi:cellulose synthase/poly-beta-1,6-N-acetylglucosamine synthase-like glycosyltransferase